MNTVRWAVALLCVLQTLMIAGTVIATSVDVRSIVFILPILSLLGLLVTCFGCGFRSIWLILFGLSPCVTSVYLAYLIRRRNWQPVDAAEIVTTVLMYYQLLVVPIGIIAFVTVIGSARLQDLVRGKRQFRLRALFIVTLAVALLFGIARLCADLGFATPVWLSLTTVTGFLEALTLIGIALHPKSETIKKGRPCPAWLLGASLVGYAIAPYVSALLVREYPSPVHPWQAISHTAAWHLPTLLLAAPVFLIVWLRGTCASIDTPNVGN